MKKQISKSKIAPAAPGEVATADHDVRKIPIDKIIPSPYQARETFSGIDELAADIKEVGLIQPIVVRPFGDLFQLVVGERRLRACRDELKWAEIDASVRLMTDREADVMCQRENISRDDVDALEAMKTFERWIDGSDKLTIDAAAARVGKDARFVARRYSLKKLIEPARELLREGTITVSHAEELARLHDANQKSALKFLIRTGYESSLHSKTGNAENYKYVGSVRELRGWIRSNVSKLLSEAIFDIHFDNYFPKRVGFGCGPCTECSKNTSNATTLFGDLVDDRARCMAPTCFNKKTKAHRIKIVKDVADKYAETHKKVSGTVIGWGASVSLPNKWKAVNETAHLFLLDPDPRAKPAGYDEDPDKFPENEPCQHPGFYVILGETYESKQHDLKVGDKVEYCTKSCKGERSCCKKFKVVKDLQKAAGIERFNHAETALEKFKKAKSIIDDARTTARESYIVERFVSETRPGGKQIHAEEMRFALLPFAESIIRREAHDFFVEHFATEEQRKAFKDLDEYGSERSEFCEQLIADIPASEIQEAFLKILFYGAQFANRDHKREIHALAIARNPDLKDALDVVPYENQAELETGLAELEADAEIERAAERQGLFLNAADYLQAVFTWAIRRTLTDPATMFNRYLNTLATDVSTWRIRGAFNWYKDLTNLDVSLNYSDDIEKNRESFVEITQYLYLKFLEFQKTPTWTDGPLAFNVEEFDDWYLNPENAIWKTLETSSTVEVDPDQDFGKFRRAVHPGKTPDFATMQKTFSRRKREADPMIEIQFSTLAELASDETDEKPGSKKWWADIKELYSDEQINV